MKNHSKQRVSFHERRPISTDSFLVGETGSSFTEYVLMASLITVVCLLALLALSKWV